jgi:hypothetical protein
MGVESGGPAAIHACQQPNQPALHRETGGMSNRELLQSSNPLPIPTAERPRQIAIQIFGI